MVTGVLENEIQGLLRGQFPRQDVGVEIYLGAVASFWMWDHDRHVPTSLLVLYKMLGKGALAYFNSLPVVGLGRSPNGGLELYQVREGR